VTGTILTLRGPVEPSALGRTLMHEHLLLNLTSEFRSDGLLNDEPLVIEELAHFAAAGGSTVVEVSTSRLTLGASPDPGGGRDSPPYPAGSRTRDNVQALQRISDATGINLVLGTGHYRQPYFDHELINTSTVTELADSMVRDIQDGFGDSGVRAGIIGEVGCDQWFVSAEEERALRAAARASKRTGVCISTHAVDYPVGLAQLDLFAEEGVDPTRVIIGHCDTVNIAGYHDEVLARGAWIQFDTFRGLWERDVQRRVRMIVRLADAGHADRILISHDVCKKSHLKAYGGRGFDFIPTQLPQLLTEAGMPPDLLDQLLVDNPARALAG
jgi:phosphotriesterase-related protein